MAPDHSERMWEMAYDMARSGEYASARDIAAALQRRGYPHAPAVLDNKRVQQELDRLCTEAKVRNIDAPRP